MLETDTAATLLELDDFVEEVRLVELDARFEIVLVELVALVDNR